ncbi:MULTISPECIES: cell division protein FtsQ/DivIB [unclassified Isoptericola]|uniref:cell division protein FtsQ/DivIB n=1 Tax=unclassified Isoptericola TaxID=2623355 RepID=UPI002712ECB8|nr:MULTISPECIES: cell division protein FtsQ/DivIB [unclassified Isoptericola]MDO8148516.1 cell division protein FtsQ/DivIB [Isoptericola sp. b515]MDO8151995.1 cell division protein FtsQ/DivIB [Isoptericola sp. b408]
MRPPPRPRAPERPRPAPAASSASPAGSGRRAAGAARSAGSARSAASPARPRPVASAPERGPRPVPAPAARDPRVSTAMADRLAERSAMRRHRSWRTALVVVLLVGLVGGAGWVVGWSDLLALDAEEVTVTGADVPVVDGERVHEIALGAAGTPLLRLDTAGMAAEIRSLRGVKDVTLARSWPHGLGVVVVAREPVAAVPDGTDYVLLDDEGVRLGRRAGVPEGLPVVSVPLEKESARALQAALAVVAALPPGLSARVEQVSARTQDDVETVLRDGLSIRWGGADRLPLKVEVVRTLRAVGGDVAVIDVSSPELPVTR